MPESVEWNAQEQKVQTNVGGHTKYMRDPSIKTADKPIQW